jgi:lysophospholipase L1-like esterase
MMRGLPMALVFCTAVATAQTPGGQPFPTPPPAAPQAPAGPPTQPLTLVDCPGLVTSLRTVVQNDPRTRDWPNLNRFRNANSSVKDARVVFMGDSITDNWQSGRFGGFFPGKAYVGRGIGGQTTPQMLLRFRPDVIELNPRVVVILAGTNDIASNTGPASDQEIEGNLASMAELAHGHGIKVVFSSITPVSAYHAAPNAAPQTTQRPMARIQAINDWMKKYAAAHGEVYLDYFSAMVDPTGVLKQDLSADDLHPTAAGYAIMAPLAEAAIAKAGR